MGRSLGWLFATSFFRVAIRHAVRLDYRSLGWSSPDHTSFFRVAVRHIILLSHRQTSYRYIRNIISFPAKHF
jgi:hypothetical protein